MKILAQILLLSTGLCVGSSIYAAVDWTPFLQSIKNSCYTGGTLNFDNIPKKYKTSVVSNKKSVDKSQEKFYGVIDKQTVTLKNATAFGAPLSKIVQEVSDGGENGNFTSLNLYFTNTKFMNSLPQFYAKYGKHTIKAGTKTVITQPSYSIRGFATGYELEETGRIWKLTFNKKHKTIKCFMGSS